MKHLILYSLCAILFSLVSCRSDDLTAVGKAMKTFKSQPNDTNAKAFASTFSAFTKAHGYENQELATYALDAAKLGQQRQRLSTSLAWYQTYFTHFPQHPDIANQLLELDALLTNFKKPDLNQMLYISFVNRFPEHPEAKAIQAKISIPNLTADSLLVLTYAYLHTQAQQESFPHVAQLYIEMVEVAIMADLNCVNGADHLLKAGDVARALKLYHRALKHYDWIIQLYPSHRLAKTAIYLKGHVHYADLNDYPMAVSLFTEYLEADPYGMYEQAARTYLNNARQQVENPTRHATDPRWQEETF